jgi:hypothetical protein
VIADEGTTLPDAVNPHVNLTPSANPPNRILQPIAGNFPKSTPKAYPFAHLPPLPERPKTLLVPPNPHIRQSNITNNQWEIGDEISPVEEEKPTSFQSMFAHFSIHLYSHGIFL